MAILLIDVYWGLQFLKYFFPDPELTRTAFADFPNFCTNANEYCEFARSTIKFARVGQP